MYDDPNPLEAKLEDTATGRFAAELRNENKAPTPGNVVITLRLRRFKAVGDDYDPSKKLSELSVKSRMENIAHELVHAADYESGLEGVSLAPEVGQPPGGTVDAYDEQRAFKREKLLFGRIKTDVTLDYVHSRKYEVEAFPDRNISGDDVSGEVFKNPVTGANERTRRNQWLAVAMERGYRGGSVGGLVLFKGWRAAYSFGQEQRRARARAKQ